MPLRLCSLGCLVTAAFFVAVAVLPSTNAIAAQHHYNAAGVMGLLAAAVLLPLRPRGRYQR